MSELVRETCVSCLPLGVILHALCMHVSHWELYYMHSICMFLTGSYITSTVYACFSLGVILLAQCMHVSHWE